MTTPYDMNLTYDYAFLVKLLREHAYQTGDFTLASGQKSNEYLNIKNAAHHPEVRHLLGEALYAHVSPLGAGDEVQVPYNTVNAVAGVSSGGIVPATILVHTMARHIRLAYQLTVNTSGKTHGSGDQIDGLRNIERLRERDPTFKWCCVLVEDVVTTGQSTHRAVQVLERVNLRPCMVVVICDRQQGGMESLRTLNPGVSFVALTTIEQLRP